MFKKFIENRKACPPEYRKDYIKIFLTYAQMFLASLAVSVIFLMMILAWGI